jgi:hypothetical protein
VASNKQKADSDADSFQLGARNDNGRLSGPDLCKHDFCKPDRNDEPCKHDSWYCKQHEPDSGKCKSDRGKSYGCKHEPRDKKCKPWHCKRDHGKPDDCKREHSKWDHGKWDHDKPDDCKSDRKPHPRHWPQDMKEGMPD